ncbi:cytochrome c [Psychromonas marina]|uniref:Cytochrome c n=1 Tax=Psychromonas marina TaxID=88364 RepID=A0ABQ6E114_9GAMM|nr:cytochrome c5 family protein [Psychromonas marina]GLS90870.1 cytochrome c [Psychromonas marina]
MQLIKCITLVIGLTASLFTASVFADQDIEARIAPVGDVYLDGQIATASTKSESDVPAGPRSGEKVYNTYCVACHATGAAGAPIKGDAAAWKPRMAQGKDTLVKHAIEGFNGVMPARGTCMDCSDDEIIATVEYLTQGL